MMVWEVVLHFRLAVTGALVLLVRLTGISDVQSEERVTIRDLITRVRSGDGRLAMLITGAGRAYEGVNMKMMLKGQQMLFCQPKNLGITPDQYFRILADYVEKSKIR